MSYKRILALYNLKSGFFLAMIGIPLIIMEVYSEGQTDNQNCMLIQEISFI